jgi:hypothetical protein
MAPILAKGLVDRWDDRFVQAVGRPAHEPFGDKALVPAPRARGRCLHAIAEAVAIGVAAC